MPHSRSLKHSFINCCFRWCIWGSLSTWIAKPKRKDRHLIDLIFWLMSSWHLWNIHRMWSSVYNRPGTSWHLAFMTEVFCVAMPACPIPFKTIWNKKHRQIQKEVLQKSTWCFVKSRVIPGFVWFEQAKQLPLMCNMFSTWFQPQWFNPYLCLPGVLLQKCLRCCNVRCAKVNRVFAVDASDSGNSWFDVGPWQQNKQTSHWQKFQMLQDAAWFFFSDKRSKVVSQLLSDYISLMAWPMAFFVLRKKVLCCQTHLNCSVLLTLDNVCGLTFDVAKHDPPFTAQVWTSFRALDSGSLREA